MQRKLFWAWLLWLGGASLGFAEKTISNSLPKILVAADGRTFVTEKGEPFVPFGVNYYRPGTGWAPQIWKQFDAEATRKDFQRMKGLGVNCVRVFLTYKSFFVEPGEVLEEGIAKFDQFLRMAEDAGIYVHLRGSGVLGGTTELEACRDCRSADLSRDRRFLADNLRSDMRDEM